MNQSREAVIKLDTLDITPIKGKVLVRVYPERYIQTAGGLILGDIESVNEEWRRFLPDAHAVRYGTVVAIPKEEMYDNNLYSTPMNISIGDEVWFDFHSGMYAPLCSCEGRWYYLLDYGTIIVKKSNDHIETLNGFLLGKTVITKVKSFLALKDEEEEPRRMIVEIAGEPINFKHGFADNEEIKVGDTIFVKEHIIMLEYDLHLYLDGNKYRYVNRKDVIAIL